MEKPNLWQTFCLSWMVFAALGLVFYGAFFKGIDFVTFLLSGVFLGLIPALLITSILFISEKTKTSVSRFVFFTILFLGTIIGILFGSPLVNSAASSCGVAVILSIPLYWLFDRKKDVELLGKKESK